MRWLISKRISQVVVLQPGYGHACSLASLPFNGPVFAIAFEDHLVPLSPPAIYVFRERDPHSIVRTQFCEKAQQVLVSVECTFTDNVVWMDYEIHEAIVLQDEIDLLPPHGHREITQDVEERMILCGRYRELKERSNKVGLYRAASSALWIQMRDVWNGSIVLKLEHVEPHLIPIKYRGAEAHRLILLGISVDLFHATFKFDPILEEFAIVIKILNVNFKSSAPDLLEKSRLYGITFFRHDLEGGRDTEGCIQVHQV